LLGQTTQVWAHTDALTLMTAALASGEVGLVARTGDELVFHGITGTTQVLGTAPDRIAPCGPARPVARMAPTTIPDAPAQMSAGDRASPHDRDVLAWAGGTLCLETVVTMGDVAPYGPVGWVWATPEHGGLRAFSLTDDDRAIPLACTLHPASR
jgi:hypothetical protein